MYHGGNDADTRAFHGDGSEGQRAAARSAGKGALIEFVRMGSTAGLNVFSTGVVHQSRVEKKKNCRLLHVLRHDGICT